MKLSLQSAIRSVDQAMMRLAAGARGWLMWPPLIAIAAGVTAWGFTHKSRLKLVLDNKLEAAQRTQLLWWIGGAACSVLLLYVAAIVVVRLWTKSWRAVATTAQLNALLSFVLAGPFLLVLKTEKIESSHDALTLFFIACAAAACAPTVMTLARLVPEPVLDDEPAWRRQTRRVLRWLVPLAVFGVWLSYAVFFSDLAITNHRAMNTRSIDLGIYDNIFYQSIHGNPLGCSFTKGGNHASAHFDPILVVLSPLYLLYPRSEMILVLQAAWVGAGVVPLYLLARHKTGSSAVGLVLAIVYALHPAAHGATMYEFHSLTLIGTPVLWSLYFLERGWAKWYFAALAVVLLVREDAPLMMSFVAFYALLTRRPKAARMGWITLIVSVAYFVLVKRYFMTSADILNTGKDSFSFAYYYRELVPPGSGFAGMLTTLLTNPVFALRIVVKEVKLVYLATMFLPVAFLSIWARRARIMLLYGVIFTMLATRKAVFSVHFQYIMLLLPALVAIAPMGLRRIEAGPMARRLGLAARQVRAGALGFMLVAAVLVSWKFGAIVENASFRGGFTRITRDPTPQQRKRYEHLQDLIAKLPRDASVTVTDRVGPHVSNRKEAYLYRHKHRTEYLLVDERELKKGLKTWHQRRARDKEIKQLAAHGSLKLFKVDLSNKKKAAKKARPPASRKSPAVKREPSTPRKPRPVDDEKR